MNAGVVDNIHEFLAPLIYEGEGDMIEGGLSDIESDSSLSTDSILDFKHVRHEHFFKNASTKLLQEF